MVNGSPCLPPAYRSPRRPATALRRTLGVGRVGVLCFTWRVRFVRFPGARHPRPLVGQVEPTLFHWFRCGDGLFAAFPLTLAVLCGRFHGARSRLSPKSKAT